VQAESVLLNGDVEEPVMACYTLAPPHDGTAGLLQVRPSDTHKNGGVGLRLSGAAWVPVFGWAGV
jgi:hypothetical protein